MTKNTTATTFDAKSELKCMRANLSDVSVEFAGYGVYICDAITEAADYNVSIYTSDNVTFALEHDEAVGEVMFSGLALGGREYFTANPNHTFRDYAAHVGQCAEYFELCQQIYEELEDAVTYAVLDHLASVYGDNLDRAAWDHVCENHDSSWDDNNEDLDDIRNEAEEIAARRPRSTTPEYPQTSPGSGSSARPSASRPLRPSPTPRTWS